MYLHTPHHDCCPIHKKIKYHTQGIKAAALQASPEKAAQKAISDQIICSLKKVAFQNGFDKKKKSRVGLWRRGGLIWLFPSLTEGK